MTRRIAILVALLGTGFFPISAQQREESVVRLDPALDAIIPPGTSVDTVKGGFGYINGLTWVKDDAGGYLLVSDIAANVVHKWTRDGAMSLVLSRPDWTLAPAARPAEAHFGANGMTLDAQGRVVYCAEGDRRLMRLEKDGTRTVLASQYDGHRLNSPNDLVIRKDGGIYFTDPAGGPRFGKYELNRELPYQGVYLWKDGTLRLLIQTMSRPNGITLSPDEKYLYINDSIDLLVMKHEVQPDGSLANGRLFIDMKTVKAPGNPDGMRVDVRGNLYSAGAGGIWVISPEGKHLGTIRPPRTAPGLTFGDADGKAIYIAAATTLARIRLNFAGAR